MTKIIEMASYWLAINGMHDFKPIVGKSIIWKKWKAYTSAGACFECASMNGKIINVNSFNVPPRHQMCRCILESVLSVLAGTATIDKNLGADYTLKHYKKLTKAYITKKRLKK